MDTIRQLIFSGQGGPAAGGYSFATLILWLVGIAILFAGMIAVMRSRWAQVQPLSKCIVLSVFVHLLLTIYAYQTRLLTFSPRPPGEGEVEFTLIADSDEAVFTESDAEPQPWDPDYQPTPVVPDLAELNAQLQESSRIEQPLRPSPAREPEESSPPTAEAPPLIARPEEPEPPSDRVAETELPLQPPELIAPDTSSEMAEAETETPLDLDSLLPETAAVTAAVAEIAVAAAESEPPQIEASEPPNERTNTIEVSDSAAEAVAALIPPAVAIVAVPGTIRVTDLPTRAIDGETMPRPYQSRQGENREQALKNFGGSERTESAVAAALDWLAQNQEPDGRWDASRFGAGQEYKVLGHDRGGAGADADTGVTGLALLAFLGAGYTHVDGDYQETLQHGLEFLLRSQAADGNLCGGSRLFARMYCHGMALLAISEAYAISGDPRLRPYVERGVQYTVRAQNSRDGGWRYQPGDPGDMSQFGWQLMALKSAELAGVKVPVQTRAGMIQFVHSSATGKSKGLSGYKPHSPPSRTMTAEAIVCRVFLNLERNPAATDEAARYLLEEPPGDGTPNLYYWYYGSLAMFQIQGPDWQTWNAALQQQLLSRQETASPHVGSWSPNTVWGGYGGRVYSTAMAALCLEVYYRYLPLYEAN